MFPHTDNFPAQLPQGASYQLVSDFIPQQLLLPKLLIISWHVGMDGTAIHKLARQDVNVLATPAKPTLYA
jgi:hypothetical protein